MLPKAPLINFTYESSSSSDEEEQDHKFDYKGLSSMFAPVPKFQYPVMKFEKMSFGKDDNEPWKEITGNILNRFAPKYAIFDFRNQSEKSPTSLVLSGTSLANHASQDLDRRTSILDSLANFRNRNLGANDNIIKSFKRFKNLKVAQKEEFSPNTLRRTATKMTLIMQQQGSHKPKPYRKIRQQQVSDVLLGRNREYQHKMIVLPKPDVLKTKRRHSFEDDRNQSDNLLKSFIVDDHAIVTDYLNTQGAGADDNNSSMTSITSRDINVDVSPQIKKERKKHRHERKVIQEPKPEAKKLPIPLGRRKSDATEYAKKVKEKLSRANVLLLNSDISVFFKNKGNPQEELKTIVIRAPRKGGKSNSIHHAFKRFTYIHNVSENKRKQSTDTTSNRMPTSSMPTITKLKQEGSKNSFGDKSSQSRLSIKLSKDFIDEAEVINQIAQLATPDKAVEAGAGNTKLGRKDSKSRTLNVPSKTSLDQIPSLDLDRLKKNEEMRESLEDVSPGSSKILPSSSILGSNICENRQSVAPEVKKHIDTITPIAKLSYKERRLLLKSEIPQMNRILNTEHMSYYSRKESEANSVAGNTITATVTAGSSPNRPSKTKKPAPADLNSLRIKNVYMLGKKSSVGSVIPHLNMDMLYTNGTTTPVTVKNQKPVITPLALSAKTSNLVRIKTLKGSISHRGLNTFKFPEDSPDRSRTKKSITPNTPKTEHNPSSVYQSTKTTGFKVPLSPKKTMSTSSSVTSKDFFNSATADFLPRKPSHPHNIRKGLKV